MKIISIVTLSATWLLIVPSCFLTGDGVQAATINGLCLTEREFTDTNTMDLAAIRAWLNASGGYLRGTNSDGTPFSFTDVDGQETDPGKVIFDSVNLPFTFTDPVTKVTHTITGGLNPRVLLTTMYKEQPSAFKGPPDRPNNDTLQFLAGWGTTLSPSARAQIVGAAQQLRRDFHFRLAQCMPTIGNWQVDTPRQTGTNPGDERDENGEPFDVTPESKVGVLYSYTPWVGEKFGGGFKAGNPRLPGTGAGGNGLFCDLWKDKFGWEVPPPSTPTIGPTSSPTLYCGNTTPRCLSLNVVGGTAPYQWVPNKGTVTPSGNGRNVQLRPPANPGSKLGGIAYLSKGDATNNNGSNVPACNGIHVSGAAKFGCNDQLLGGMEASCTNAMASPTGWNVCWTSPGGHCAPASACGGLPCCGETFYNAAHNYLKDNRGAGIIAMCDAAKNSSCNPCGLSMVGATVTVRDNDGNGTPVTVPVTLK
jgi:hypothetical protein